MAHVFEKKWRSQDVRLKENADFSSLLLGERVLEGLKKAGFKKPSPIQLEAIPLGKFGKDLLVQAKSGTGKTLVFVVIALEMLQRKLFRPQVLIIVPTREIATQVTSVVKAVGCKFHKLTCNNFIGGLPLFQDQEKAVMTQIVVGTPGRLRQLIQLQSLPTNSIRMLIFDEADELLSSSSFRDDLEDIFKALPDDKQIIATSATFSPKVKKILFRFLCDPKLVRLNAKHLALLGMVHYAGVVQYCPMPVILYKSKIRILERILKTVKFAQCLVFCNGIQRVEVLYRDLKRWGFSVAYISSAKEQSDRLKAMERLKRFKCKVLVSSDLTSRGIDAENVDLVVNFDLAYTTEVYMHRVGRAGRFGSVGVAISIVEDREIGYLQRIEKGGSFKAFKLPDPLPKDLILYPPEGEFVISEPVSEKKVVKPSNKAIWKAFNDDGYELENKVNAENIQGNHVSEINVGDTCESELASADELENTVNAENIQGNHVSEINVGDTCESELADDHVEKEFNTNIQVKDIFEICSDIDDNDFENGSSELTASIKSHDDITKHIVDFEKADENIVYSKDNNIQLNKQTSDKKLQVVKQDKNMIQNLLNDCDQNEIINNEFTDTCNIYENPEDVCDKNAFEKQDIVSDIIENDTMLINQLCNINDLEKNDFETNDDKLRKIYTDNIPESSQPEDVIKTLKDNSANCEQDVKSCNVLNNMIKTFIDTYESNKIMELTTSETTFNHKPEDDSDRKHITIDMINNLKFQRQAFFYKAFKKFQELKNECSAYEKEDKVKSSEGKSNTDLVEEIPQEKNTIHEELVENSEVDGKEVFPQKPTFESTPQLNDKIKLNTVKMPIDEADNKSVIPNILSQLLHGVTDESDSDDSETNEETSEVAKETSSLSSESASSSNHSETSSLSSDSEDYSETEDSTSGCSESSSDTTDSSSSTENEDDEIDYDHRYSCTGRQNPALVSCPVRGQAFNDQSYNYKYFQDLSCTSCGGRKKEIPREDSYFSRAFGDPPYFFDDRETSYSRRGAQKRNRKEKSFADHNITQSLPRKHSKCCRSLRNAAREGDQSRNACPTYRRSSHHRHTFNCFVPTGHRCHPNTPDFHCRQGQLCEMWYKTFYNQWLHIQSVIN